MSAFDPHWRYSYLDCVARADRAAALALVRELRGSGVSADRILLDLVCYAQERVGRNWECNRWNVAREHAATAVSEAVVAYLAAEGDVRTDRGSVVVTCVEEEWHSMPARIVAEVMRLAGWETTFLGAATPVAHLVEFVREQQPRAVAMSCSVPTALPRVREMVEGVRAELVPTLLGGRGVRDRRTADLLGADAYGATAAAAVYALEHLPAATTPAPPMPVPDDAAAVLEAHGRDVADAALAQVGACVASFATMAAVQREHTRADLEQVVGFTAAALFVDDDRILVEFAEWMDGVLTSRGLPGGVTDLALAATAGAMAELGLPRALRFVDAARDGLRAVSPRR